MTLNRAYNFESKLSEEARKRGPSPLKTLGKYRNRTDLIKLGGGMPVADYFPWDEIKTFSPVPNGKSISRQKDGIQSESCVVDIFKNDIERSGDVPLSDALQYGHSKGQPEFLSFIKEHISLFHDMRYEDWDVVATIGSTQSWDATLRIFCDKGDTILVESYSFASAIEAAETQGITVFPVPMDKEGINPTELRAVLSNWESGKKLPKFLYVIPTGQNPTGSMLSNERRLEVYEICKEYDLLIIEDEPYYFLQMDPYGSKTNAFSSEDEFRSSLVKSFISIDTDGRVIRLDSFSKVLAPGTRLGWVIGSEALLKHYVNINEVTVQSPSGFSQAAVTSLLNRWGQQGFTKWLMALRREYTIRRDATFSALEKYLPEVPYIRTCPPEAGMFFTIVIDLSFYPLLHGEFNGDLKKAEEAIFERFISNGVLVVPGSWFKTKGMVEIEKRKKQTTEIFFRGTYASTKLEVLEEGMKKLAETLKQEFAIEA